MTANTGSSTRWWPAEDGKGCAGVGDVLEHQLGVVCDAVLQNAAVARASAVLKSLRVKKAAQKA